jgi:hypothetical protein
LVALDLPLDLLVSAVGSVVSRFSKRIAAAGAERRCAAAIKMLRSASALVRAWATAPSARSENKPCGA